MTALIGTNTTATVANLTDGRSFGLGDRYTDDVGNEYIYVQASEALTQYDFVAVDENFAASQLTATEAGDGWQIGVTQATFASSDYGWIATRGCNLQGRVGASCAADAALRTSSTAGVIDDNTTGTALRGIVAVGANTKTSATNVEVMLTFPRSATF